MEKDVLITGCSGLIGMRIANDLTERGYRVLGLDKKRPKDSTPFAKVFECDLTEDEDVAKTMQGVANFSQQLASVIHLAAYYDFSGKDSPLYDALTVEGTRRLLRQLRTMQVGQFMFASTLLVMKPVTEEGGKITETSPTAATWAYPESKLKAERVIADERGSIPVVIHRLAGVYDEHCHSIPIANQIARIYERKLESHFYPGNQDFGQPFIHLDDAASCFARTIEKRSSLDPVEYFLTTEDDLVPYGTMQDLIGQAIHGKEWTTIRIPKVVAKAGAWAKDMVTDEEQFIQPWMVDMADAHYPVDNSYVKNRLMWVPFHRLRDTIEDMVNELKHHPRQWYEENGLAVPEEVNSEPLPERLDTQEERERQQRSGRSKTDEHGLHG